MLGRVQIPVADVARNGCLKDTWALLVSSQIPNPEPINRSTMKGSTQFCVLW
jgi:hypothetical protein